MPVPVWELIVAGVVTAAAAAVQSTVGIGFALVSVPVLALLDARLAPVPQLLLAVPLAVAMAVRERHAMELRGVGWVLAGRLPGAAIGLILLKLASGDALNGVVGSMVLAAVLIVAGKAQVRRTPATQFGAGVASGATGLVAAIGGPPLALLYRDARGPVVRSSLAAIFSVGITLSVVVRAFAGEMSLTDVEVALWLALPLAAGFLAGGRVLLHVDERILRNALLTLSGLAAVALIARSVL